MTLPSSDAPTTNDARSLGALERVETAFAILHFGPDEVFKRRKPVRLTLAGQSFALDSPARRREACLEEQRLCEQLTPGTALEVVPLRFAHDGTPHVDRRHGPADWALRMRRLREADRADRRLERGGLDEAALQAVARHLARFHEGSRGRTEGDPDRALDALGGLIGLPIEAPDWPRRTPPPEALERIEADLRRFFADHRSVLLARIESSAIREGHGELSLAHVFVDDAGDVAMLPGLELGPRLRDVDVALDTAMLAADLGERRRSDLAERFVAEYARLANDFDLYPLLDFYTALGATIRARLDGLCADREQPGSASERRYRERARRWITLALGARREPLLPPIVVAMGGQVASGKSTVAVEIARLIGAPVVGSDPTRDFLLGARLDESLHEVHWEQSYEPGFGERVYAETLRRAGAVLETGRPVVIDGCFRSRAQRGRARALADRFGLPFVFVEANVPRPVQIERLAERAARDGVPIDDWVEIADALRSEWESADDLPAACHVALDTSQPVERAVATLRQRLPSWPSELTG